MSQTLKHLSAFQRDILFIICDLNRSYGLGIKSELEEYYNKDINTGRVYHNLDQLVDQGYLEKSPIDQRTNSYELTEKAIKAMNHHNRWQKSRAEGSIPV